MDVPIENLLPYYELREGKYEHTSDPTELYQQVVERRNMMEEGGEYAHNKANDRYKMSYTMLIFDYLNPEGREKVIEYINDLLLSDKYFRYDKRRSDYESDKGFLSNQPASTFERYRRKDPITDISARDSEGPEGGEA